MKPGVSERAAWGEDFPSVIRNGDLKELENEPEYAAAKGGDFDEAIKLVDKVIKPETIQAMRETFAGRSPSIVPVVAEEAEGSNMIPLAFAYRLSEALDVPVERDIIQTERAYHTNSGSDHRLAFNPNFGGDVKAGKDYFIVDDTLAMGGSIASLRGYLENRGGNVIGAAVVTAYPTALDIKVSQGQLAGIEQKHGPAMNKMWQEEFGYGIDKLTKGEAGHVKAANSVDALRARINEARHNFDSRRASRSTEQSEQSAGLNEGETRRASGRPIQDGEERAQTFSEAENREGEQFLKSSWDDSSDVDSSLLVSEAEGLERGLGKEDGISIDQQYDDAIALAQEQKTAQVNDLEDRLQTLVSKEKGITQGLENRAPGMFSRPKTRRNWNDQYSSHSKRLLTLQNRLDYVQNIRDDLTPHGSRLDEMARAKVEREDPELVQQWKEMQEAQRRHVEFQRQKKREERKLEDIRSQSRGRSQGLKRDY